MERKSLADLLAWREKPGRKPLVLQGARQVGKTWILKEFGRRAYSSVAYINFEANPRMTSLFSSSLETERLLAGLRIEAGCPIDPGKTLIVFDEVQENPRALTSLKYFAENAPEYHLVAAGSLLGVAMHKGSSFPVGKVDFLGLHPLSFEEFLWALGEQALADLILRRDIAMMEAFRDKLIEYLKYYFFVGGMPECVSYFAATRDAAGTREIQLELLDAYERDFSKHADAAAVPRIRAVWNSIPAQLAREQRKFTYGLIRQGARAREYELAIQWLCDAGLFYKVHRASKPGIPLRAYREDSTFKLFMLDTGLLAAHARIPLNSLLAGSALFTEAKGALTEQYVAQELHLRPEIDLFYWSSDTSGSEVDFLVQSGESIYPIEVKAAENLQAKSLKAFRDRFSPPRSIRVTLSPYREESWLTNVPLYGLFGWG
ncbi:MAG TPA: ATP-binding protein [Rectinemataceae bacterium]